MSAGSTDYVKPRTVGDAAYLHDEGCPRANPDAPLWALCRCAR